MLRLHWVFLCLAGAVCASHAADTNLIDFSSKSKLIAKENIYSNDVSVDDFPLPMVTTPGGAFDRSRSTTAERIATGVFGGGRALFATASLTYDLGSTTFKLRDHDADQEIVLWLHVDGPVLKNPASGPLAGSDDKPQLIQLELLTDGDVVYTSRKRRCTRGWNELTFPLTTEVPTPKCPDPLLNHRVTHFTQTGTNGEDVHQIRIKILGTNDSPTSYTVTKVRFNGCTLRPLSSPCPIILMYDEGWSGVKTFAKPLIDNFDMKATISVIGSNYTGRPMKQHMGATELNTLFNDNQRFDFVNQTFSNDALHNDAAPVTYAALKKNIEDGMSALMPLNRNSSTKFLIYPGGAYDAQVFNAMDELGVVAGRTNTVSWDPDNEVSVMQDPCGLNGYDAAAAENGLNGYVRSYSLQQIEDWIDEGVAQGKPRIIIFQDINYVSTTNKLVNWKVTNSVAWHSAVLNYLNSLGGKVTFKTLPEWHGSLDGIHKIRGIHY